jgi:archaellin
MQTRDLTAGDTVVFWIKADAALDNNITFAIGTSADLQASATETYAINTSGTGWEKHSFDLSGVNDDTAAYFGIYLSTDAEGTFYLDNVIFDDIASQNGRGLVLDDCDYVEWADDTDLTMTRETTDKMEGTGSLKGVIGTDMALNDTIVSHAMAAKDWSDGDTITFWVKAEAALDSNMTFAIGTTADLQASATESVLVNPSGTGWEKHTLTLSGDDDDSAVYYGLYLSTDAEGTFYLDGIECKASLNQTGDPMVAYANQLVLTLSNVSDGEAIDFTTTTDADGDGIISDESTRNHKITISYSDEYQQITDLAWTKSVIGKDDNDNLLENNEKFQITVDLTNVNNNADWSFEKVEGKHKFTIEIKPNKGAVMVIERSIPARVLDINNLN